MDLKKKIEQYYKLKKLKDDLDKRVEQLNKEIKEELDPGIHELDNYRVTLQLKRKYEIDENLAPLILNEGLYGECTRERLDPDLLQSAYLAGRISDTTMRSIRTIKLVPNLSVDKIDV